MVIKLKSKLQNHGLTYGDMLYKVKCFKFCQSNHTYKLSKTHI